MICQLLEKMKPTNSYRLAVVLLSWPFKANYETGRLKILLVGYIYDTVHVIFLRTMTKPGFLH